MRAVSATFFGLPLAIRRRYARLTTLRLSLPGGPTSARSTHHRLLRREAFRGCGDVRLLNERGRLTSREPRADIVQEQFLDVASDS